MKSILSSINLKKMSFCLIAFPFLLLAGCDPKKAEIDAERNAAVDSLDHQIKAVDEAAEKANIQAEETAAISKANIEAERETTKAQLEADKLKAEAEAKAAKARIDAGR
ncbi:MAG: hypothetical protein JJU00_04845 [Opitutales bacterium]|nr:hypothetical protein [Opitutales bacterium]